MKQEIEGEETERVRYLDTLCILSFTGIALWIYRDIRLFIDYRKGALATGGYYNSESFLVGIALNLVILIGVILMWKYKKAGFIIYAIFQVVWLTLPLFIDTWTDTYFGLLAPIALCGTLAFIMMYAFNLKHMRW